MRLGFEGGVEILLLGRGKRASMEAGQGSGGVQRGCGGLWALWYKL